MPTRPDEDGFVLQHNSSGLLVRKDGKALNSSSSGNTHTKAAGSTTTVFTNTTFDGSTGSTGYTVGDIVLALKTVGILAP